MRAVRYLAAGLAVSMIVAGCGQSGPQPNADETLRIYASVTQDTVDAVVEGFEVDNPGVTVEVFRAATGELSARIAAELRDGQLGADVLWLTDPLSMQQYERDGLLRSWTPEEVGAVPSEYRTGTFFGTRLLNLIIVHGTGLDDPPADWWDLAEVEGVVALADPAFAGSAFAALGFFALNDDYGMDYYRHLADAGAVQVQAPSDVITGVAEGLYAAGITLDRLARTAVADGSPMVLVWPASGAIAVYSPIAVVDTSTAPAAQAFIDHVLSVPGQEAIASTGWQPVRADVAWEYGGPVLVVDWSEAFDRQDELLDTYASIFGG